MTKMKRDFFAIGLGASAGGLPALIEFFKSLPANDNFAFVIVSHLARDYRSNLDKILSKFTSLPVVRVENNIKIKHGRVYVIIENTHITVKNGVLEVHLRDDKVQNCSIDIFLESLADDFKERAIGIIFSGGGSDGLEGSKAINSNGGSVMVQDPNSAEVNGMPLSVIMYDHPTEILKPEDLAMHIDQLYKRKDFI